MNNLIKLSVCGLALAILSGCAGYQLEKAKMAAPQGSAFQQALYKDYLDLSSLEFKEGDYQDSDAFAMRAVASTGGGAPDPEAIEARNLPEGKVGELATARGRLVAALGKGAADSQPDLAAHAQAMFDCWMQEQEENFQPKDIERCRAMFMDDMGKLETAMMPKPMAAPAPPPPPKPMKIPGPFVVYFDFDSAEIDARASGIIKEAAKGFAESGASKVILRGHTDKAGNVKYNEGLSRFRVNEVGNAIMQAGVARGAVTKNHLGESEPQIDTPDGERLASNRRVEIILQK